MEDPFDRNLQEWHLDCSLCCGDSDSFYQLSHTSPPRTHVNHSCQQAVVPSGCVQRDLVTLCFHFSLYNVLQKVGHSVQLPHMPYSWAQAPAHSIGSNLGDTGKLKWYTQLGKFRRSQALPNVY